MQRLANGELPIHARSRDPHPLLAARLAQLVEFRAIEELAEDAGDLVLDNARTVVLHHDTRLPVALAHLHADLGKYPCFLASIERVVHRLFDGGHQRLGRRVEPEQVTVLEKELRNGDFTLPSSHIGGGGGCRLPVRHDSYSASPPRLPAPQIKFNAGVLPRPAPLTQPSLMYHARSFGR